LGEWKIIDGTNGLTGAVYPTLILMGRGVVLHATIVKAIKIST
jgi:hypothetical protein